MALAAATSAIKIHPTFLQTSLPPNPLIHHRRRPNSDDRNTTPLSISCSSSNKIIRIRPLDRAATKHNKLRFATKLKTLLLSKPPHHSLPLSVLFKCRRYLSLNPSHRAPLPDMVSRYPLLFQFFRNPDTDALSVRLSPEALLLAADESATRSKLSSRLATTLHKLLMLSRPRRLLLDKLVHLAPDLGLPPNFRSRLANEHPERFRVVSTSYGRSLELVAWDSELAVPFPHRNSNSSFHDGPIIDRPPRFRKLNLPRGMNLKRRHRNYLFKIGDLPEVSPYDENPSNEGNDYGCGEDLLAEKRACAVVREVLSMTVEKRTLVDHITHFRHEFGLSNKVRSMLIRHPELFYVSPKGIRDSVFLVEGYDDKGRLVERDDGLMEMKDKLMELVREGKRLRRVRKRGLDYGVDDKSESEDEDEEEEEGEDEGMEEVMKIGEMGGDWEEVGVLEGGEGFTDDDDGGGEEERRKFWSLRELEDKEGGGLVLLEPW